MKQSIWMKDLGYSINVWIQQTSQLNDRDQNIRAFAPLLIHSIDSTVIWKTIRICSIEYQFTPITVHDCIVCHPNDMQQLIHAFQKSIFEILGSNTLSNKVLLEKIWIIPISDSITLNDPSVKFKIINHWDQNLDLLCQIQSNLIFNSFTILLSSSIWIIQIWMIILVSIPTSWNRFEFS